MDERDPATPSGGQGDLAEHEVTAVDTVARLRARHDQKATALQRAVDGVTDRLGRPYAAIGLVLAFAAGLVVAAVRSQGRLDDAFAIWLELAATLAALVIALLIFVSQRRGDLLAERRAELTLQLALLTDAKNARIISLLQDFRRDLPEVADADDPEADEMATPVDPGAVMDAMEQLDPGKRT